MIPLLELDLPCENSLQTEEDRKRYQTNEWPYCHTPVTESFNFHLFLLNAESQEIIFEKSFSDIDFIISDLMNVSETRRKWTSAMLESIFVEVIISIVSLEVVVVLAKKVSNWLKLVDLGLILTHNRQRWVWSSRIHRLRYRQL
jgi:hypothetical protein